MHVLYFANIREQLGVEAEQVELSAGITDVESLIKFLCTDRDPKWQAVLTDPNLLVSVNQEVSSLETVLTATDEVAFFPPVTGG